LTIRVVAGVRPLLSPGPDSPWTRQGDSWSPKCGIAAAGPQDYLITATWGLASPLYRRCLTSPLELESFAIGSKQIQALIFSVDPPAPCEPDHSGRAARSAKPPLTKERTLLHRKTSGAWFWWATAQGDVRFHLRIQLHWYHFRGLVFCNALAYWLCK